MDPFMRKVFDRVGFESVAATDLWPLATRYQRQQQQPVPQPQQPWEPSSGATIATGFIDQTRDHILVPTGHSATWQANDCEKV
ncbi:GL26990 [Drosophila persimilis]|uniref:GL26990 n=1 Tax=Drosophila persimilis TaxID=7234 RepID=B4H7F7_DROPE|nr:GL26990 [Drosophila persimilis]